jgi:CDP-diacylglycerol---serine O-phosphatidyltransferase
MTDSIRRSSAIEDPTNRLIFHPLSMMIVPALLWLRISANMTSVMGMLCGIAAAYFYHFYDASPTYSIIAFGLMGLWHVFDGADGQVARATNTQSELGKLIDGVCDYVVYISVYVSIAITLQSHIGPLIWVLVVAAGAAHAVQAGAYEAQRQMFDFWALGKKSAALPDMTQPPERGFLPRFMHGYGRMQLKLSGIERSFIDALETHSSDGMRQDYAATFARSVRIWGILCPNYRTYGIFVASVVGHPAWYFAVELIGLTGINLLLAARQRIQNAAFVSQLVNSKPPLVIEPGVQIS